MTLRGVWPHALTIALSLTPAVSVAEEGRQEDAALFQASFFGPQSQTVSERRGVTGLRITALWSTNTDVSGMDLGLGVTETRNFTGLQIAGVLNKVRGDVTGLQIGGLANGVDRDMTGVQISYLGNSVGREVTGIQMAVFFNTVGLSFAGKRYVSSNWGPSGFTGVQIALIGNYGGDNMRGVQIGLMNQAVNCSGLQIGLFNHCKDMYGVQIGLWNQIDDSPVPALPFINAKF